MESAIFLAFGVFFVKHFVVDFLLQPRWMCRNKARFGHPGGLAHAALHGIVTALILPLCLYGLPGLHMTVVVACWLGLIEFSAHYLIDWAKMNVNLVFAWGPTTHQEFWNLLGFDQLLHYMTYLFILMYWFG